MFISTLIKQNAKSVPMHISFPSERFIVKYQNIYGMREEAMAGFTELGDSLPLQQRKVHRSQAS